MKMNKHIYLGIDKTLTKCCILKSIADKETILSNLNSLDESDFTHDCTNWMGCDEIDRTLKIENYHTIGEVIPLVKPLIYRGSDDDMGHSYDWQFTVYCLQPVAEI